MLADVKDLLVNEESGATAVEYAIMVSLIAAFIILTVGALGAQIKAVFAGVVTALGG